MLHPPRPLAVAVIVMCYLPLIAVMVLVGYAFGWEIPAALLVCLGAVWYRERRIGLRPVAVGRVRTSAELLAAALLGSLIGGLLFGGLGVVLGSVVGFLARLSEIPVTRRNTGGDSSPEGL